MYRMSEFDAKIYHSLIDNSILFFREAFGRLLQRDNDNFGTIENKLLTLTCAELQISLELAVRAALVRHGGVKETLKDDQAQLSEEEIQQKYTDKTLKVEDFEKQKNYLKSSGISRLTKKEFHEIERFQLYRNKIVHFSCEFTEEELNTLRDDILYYVVHVILVLLADTSTGETPAEYLQSKLGYDFYDQIKTYKPYINAMEKYAAKNHDKVWTCIGCMHRTYTPEWDFCYCCGYETLSGYKRADCGSCGTKDSVIYDHLDIHLEGNHHHMHGFCMDCGEHTEVFECPICYQAHDMSLDGVGVYCDEDHCVNR